MKSFKTYVFVIITFMTSFLTITAVPTLVGAQNQNQSQSSSNANATVPHKMGVKIISPLKNSTVSVRAAYN